MRLSRFLPLLFAVVQVSCERRPEIIGEGNFEDNDSTVYHWKAFIRNDTFIREVTLKGIIVNVATAASEEDFRDSTFSETDYFANGKPHASRTFRRGAHQGVWKSWYEDGQLKSSSLIDAGGLRDYFFYYEDGSNAITASRQPDGMKSHTERWRNSNLKEEFLTDSLGNGRCVNYYSNGMKSDSGRLYLYVPVDTWKRWDSTGTVRPDTTYGHVEAY